jgi:hypothetical protein
MQFLQWAGRVFLAISLTAALAVALAALLFLFVEPDEDD